jgi:hypothetical protein
LDTHIGLGFGLRWHYSAHGPQQRSRPDCILPIR